MIENWTGSFSSKFGPLIILVGIVVMFILGLMPSSAYWIIIKIILFLAVLSLTYLYLQDIRENKNSLEQSSQIEVTDSNQDWLEIGKDRDVESNFDQFLENSLQLIKKILVSYNIILLFANYEKGIFTIRKAVTDNADFINFQQTPDLEAGLPAMVLRNRSSLIENNLPPESSKILTYYRQGENPSKSFAAVPVFFNQLIIGVICADSAVEEAYGNDDLDILNRLGNLITLQLVCSNRLYEYESENWIVNLLFEISQEINRIQNANHLWNYLTEKIPKIVECERISISRLLDDEEAQIVSIRGGTGNLIPGKIFPLSDGVVGWILRKNQTLMVDDFSEKENYVPRFYSEETQAKDIFSLLAVPISNQTDIIGAICLESLQPGKFKDQHKRILQTIANQIATVLITAETMDNLKSLTFKDINTNLENLNAFELILPKEIKKAKQYDYEFDLLFIKIIFKIKEEDNRIPEKTIQEFLTLILPSLTWADYIFRLSNDTFTLQVMDYEREHIQKYTNSLIHKVKEKPIWANGLSTDFKIFLGLVPFTFLETDPVKSIEKGHNILNDAQIKDAENLLIYKESIDSGSVRSE